MKAINNNNIGIKFNEICYNINDISRIWYNYDEGKLKWILNNQSASDPYFISIGKDKALKYIDFINKYKYSKIIKF